MIKIKIAIIDADLIGRKKHRFPNLACMKLSSYYKSIGADVELKLDYENLDTYDKVTISKVFMDTEIPFETDDKSLKTEDTIDLFYKDNLFLIFRMLSMVVQDFIMIGLRNYLLI